MLGGGVVCQESWQLETWDRKDTQTPKKPFLSTLKPWSAQYIHTYIYEIAKYIYMNLPSLYITWLCPVYIYDFAQFIYETLQRILKPWLGGREVAWNSFSDSFALDNVPLGWLEIQNFQKDKVVLRRLLVNIQFHCLQREFGCKVQVSYLGSKRGSRYSVKLDFMRRC